VFNQDRLNILILKIIKNQNENIFKEIYFFNYFYLIFHIFLIFKELKQKLLVLIIFLFYFNIIYLIFNIHFFNRSIPSLIFIFKIFRIHFLCEIDFSILFHQID